MGKNLVHFIHYMNECLLYWEVTEQEPAITWILANGLGRTFLMEAKVDTAWLQGIFG